MKTVVLGAKGQLGRDLCPRLAGEVIPLTRAEVDLTQADQLREILHTARPNLVINCTAYNLVDRAESEPDAAFAVNAWAVASLARICAEIPCPLVHFSTDYVFGLGNPEHQPLRESDLPGPVSNYGLSKLSGEYLIQTRCAEHLIIRTCGLYGVWGTGGKGGNFVETMLRLAGQGKPLKVVDDQRCTPSYTVDVARTAIELLSRQARGLYHVSNAGDCSWYELAREIFSQSNVTVEIDPITSAEFGAAAQRPRYSVLSPSKLTSAGIAPPRHWTDALAAYLLERKEKHASS